MKHTKAVTQKRRNDAHLLVFIVNNTSLAEPGSASARIGFAPYDGEPRRRIAFSVLVENGGYGGTLAAPIAREIVEAATILGIIGGEP